MSGQPGPTQQAEFSLLADLPWDLADGMAPGFEPAEVGGRAHQPARKVLVRPRLRLDQCGNAYLLNHAGEPAGRGAAIHVVRAGRLEQRIPLPPVAGERDARTIIDFLPGNEQVFVLQTLARPGGRVNQLFALNSAGTVQWLIEGPHLPLRELDGESLAGSFGKLLAWADGSLLLVPVDQAPMLGRVDGRTGTWLAPLQLQPLQTAQVFATSRYQLVRTVFLEQPRRYGVARTECGGGGEQVVSGGDDAYGALQFVFGVDDNLYLYAHPGKAQCRVSPAGGVDSTDHLLDLAYLPEVAEIWALRAAGEGLQLDAWKPEGPGRQVCLEVGTSASLLEPRLLPPKDRDEIHVHTGAAANHPGEVLVFSRIGAYIGRYPFVPDSQAPLGALSRYTDWQVAGDGSVIIPLTTSTACQLIRWDWRWGKRR